MILFIETYGVTEITVETVSDRSLSSLFSAVQNTFKFSTLNTLKLLLPTIISNFFSCSLLDLPTTKKATAAFEHDNHDSNLGIAKLPYSCFACLFCSSNAYI